MRFFNRKFYAQLYSLNEMRNSQSLSKSLPLPGEHGTVLGRLQGKFATGDRGSPVHGFWFLMSLQNGVSLVVNSCLPRGGKQVLTDVGKPSR